RLEVDNPVGAGALSGRHHTDASDELGDIGHRRLPAFLVEAGEVVDGDARVESQQLDVVGLGALVDQPDTHGTGGHRVGQFVEVLAVHLFGDDGELGGLPCRGAATGGEDQSDRRRRHGRPSETEPTKDSVRVAHSPHLGGGGGGGQSPVWGEFGGLRRDVVRQGGVPTSNNPP